MHMIHFNLKNPLLLLYDYSFGEDLTQIYTIFIHFCGLKYSDEVPFWNIFISFFTFL